MAQQVLTHPRTDQSFCFRALSSGAKAIAAAAAKWVLGLKSEFARPAPVTVGPFHIHLKKEESSSVLSGPTQFKPVLFKGQLYMTIVMVKLCCEKKIQMTFSKKGLVY